MQRFAKRVASGMRYLALRSWFRPTALAVLALLLIFATLGPGVWLLGWGDGALGLEDAAKTSALATIRTAVIGTVAASAAAGALYFTARTYRLNYRRQISAEFSRAAKGLAAEKLEKRLGAIFTIEHILRDSARDHERCLRLLSSYIRNARLREDWSEGRGSLPAQGTLAAFELPPDIDAAMKVIAGRPNRQEPDRCDLRGVDLRRLSLRRFDFVDRPSLRRVFLTRADLEGADLRGADLSGAILNYARLNLAWLTDVDFTHAALIGADLRGASLEGAKLRDAQLDEADLREATGLTPKQLSNAFISSETLLPENLRDDGWVKARLAECASAPAPRSPWWNPAETPVPADYRPSHDSSGAPPVGDYPR